jgi:hypothetical protein
MPGSRTSSSTSPGCALDRHERLLPAPRLDHRDRLLLEVGTPELPRRPVVVDDQDRADAAIVERRSDGALSARSRDTARKDSRARVIN